MPSVPAIASGCDCDTASTAIASASAATGGARPAARGARPGRSARTALPGVFRLNSVATLCSRSSGIFFSTTRQVGERLRQQPLAQLDRFGVLQALQVVTDRGARFRGHDEVHPRRVRRRALGGDDLDRLAVAQRRAQRHEATIDFGGDAMVADVGVHGVREVDGGRVARHAPDLAARREHVDLVGEQVELDALHEFFGAAAVRHLHQVLQPLARAVAIGLGPGPRRVLYCQCAAMPDSATRCMSSVRICTSIGMPFGPNSVVCSD